jgi:hypothetical protein
MSCLTSLGVEYLSRAQLPLELELWWDSVLGLAHFGSRPIARRLHDRSVNAAVYERDTLKKRQARRGGSLP